MSHPPPPGEGKSRDRMSPPLISYTDVAKTFDGGRVVAVDDVSLDVAEGEFLAIVGGSGSGKTTLLRLANPPIEGGRGTIHRGRRGRAQCRPDRVAAADRLCVPERRVVSASHRRRQYRHHAKTARLAFGRDRRAGRRTARFGTTRSRAISRPAAARIVRRPAPT